MSNAYAYNGLDQRSGKADSGGTFSFLRSDDGIASPVLSDGAATYNYGSGLTSEFRGGTSKFYQADGLGSTRELTNSAGAVTDAHETDAFGNTIASSGSSPTPFGFAGQAGYQTDSDTGLKLLGHRYYDSSTGRFISRDPIQDGHNWYAYCGNDPVNGIDPTGNMAALAAGGLVLVEAGPVGWAILAVVAVIIIVVVLIAADSQPQKLPVISEPDTRSQTVPDANGKTTIRDYGPDGRVILDIHINHPPSHGPNPHAHDWTWPEDGGDPERSHPGRDLGPGELISGLVLF